MFEDDPPSGCRKFIPDEEQTPENDVIMEDITVVFEDDDEIPSSSIPDEDKQGSPEKDIQMDYTYVNFHLWISIFKTHWQICI